jgi:hypothetical protein
MDGNPKFEITWGGRVEIPNSEFRIPNSKKHPLHMVPIPLHVLLERSDRTLPL